MARSGGRSRRCFGGFPLALLFLLMALGAITTWSVAWWAALYAYSPHANVRSVKLSEDAYFSVGNSRGRGVTLAEFGLTHPATEPPAVERMRDAGLTPAWTATFLWQQRRYVVPPAVPAATTPAVKWQDLFAPASLSEEEQQQVKQWVSALVASGRPQARPSLFRYAWRERACGWPMLALRSPIESGGSGARIGSGVLTLPKACERILPRPVRRVLPHRPSWLGFTVNTLFYAALWLPIVLCAGSLRRWCRRRRGRCSRCAYHLHGGVAAGCPECGWGRDTR